MILTPVYINDVGIGRIDLKVYQEIPDPISFRRYDIIFVRGRQYINSATSISDDSWIEIADLSYQASIDEQITARIDDRTRQILHDKILVHDACRHLTSTTIDREHLMERINEDIRLRSWNQPTFYWTSNNSSPIWRQEWMADRSDCTGVWEISFKKPEEVENVNENWDALIAGETT